MTQVPLARLLAQIPDPSSRVIQERNHLTEFEPIMVRGHDVIQKLFEAGAKLLPLSFSKSSDTGTYGYQVYSFRGIALVVGFHIGHDIARYLVFAVRQVDAIPEARVIAPTIQDGSSNGSYGKSITLSSYVKAVRAGLAKLFSDQSVTFPEVPLRFALNNNVLRRPESGLVDFRGFPKRVLAARRLGRTRATR